MYFYVPSIEEKSLQGTDTDHFFVMRVQVKDKVYITDFKGNLRHVKVRLADKKRKLIVFSHLSTTSVDKPVDKVLYQAIPEKQYLEKLFEIIPHQQVTKVILFFAQHSLKYNFPFERITRILTRSLEQSQQCWIPEIIIKTTLQDAIEGQVVTVLDQEGQTSKYATNANVVVGPEGGWGDKELAYMAERKLEKISLGKVVYPSWLASFAYYSKL
jgi:RsmE family RNA methyltransferase